MMLSNQEEMAERKSILENDRRVREQGGSTFLDHTHNDVGGRFAAVSNPTVVGTAPNPASVYPQGPAWCADPGSQCVEPPLGYDNPALDPSAPPEPPPGASEALATEPNPAPGRTSVELPPLAELRSGLGSSFRTFRRL